MTVPLDGVFCARHGPPEPRLSRIDLFEEAMVIMFPPDHPFSEMSSVPLRAITEYHYVERLHCEFRKEILVSSSDRTVSSSKLSFA